MLKKRLVVSLLWRDGVIVQSIGFKHRNVVGDPKVAIEFFNAWDADEIVLLNVSRKPSDSAAFIATLDHVCRHCFLPLTVGGWIEDVDYAKRLIARGADKLVINTAGLRNPGFITEVADVLGSQCVVVGIDVKRAADGRPEVFVDRGRVALEMDAVSCAKRAADAGAGEILLTSIDQDGSLKGYDTDLIRSVADAVRIPVIAFGGVGKWDHLVDGIAAGADAVSAGNIFHFTEQSTRAAKRWMRQAGVPVR